MSTSNELLRCEEVGPAGDDADYAIVWMHGLGASGHDFVPAVPMLRRPKTRFVFPHAPSMPVTINGGYVMPAWYDILGMGSGSPQDAEGIRRSIKAVEALVRREHERGLPYERIAVAGFSQGGAIAVQVGLRFPERLAGIVALSTYLVLEDDLAKSRSAANRETPVFAGHGTHDPMVTPERGAHLAETLRKWGQPVEECRYAMQHEVCAEEFNDLAKWMETAFPAVNAST